jgi:flagellar biosynthesis chaperone FliJ
MVGQAISHAHLKPGELIVEYAEIQRRLESAKTQKSKMEGQREQLLHNLRELGHESVESAQTEIQELEQYIATNEPAFNQQCNEFFAANQSAITALGGLK